MLGHYPQTNGGDGGTTSLEDGPASVAGPCSEENECPAPPFTPVEWKGERRIPLPALGGKLLFRRARGEGIDVHKLEQCRVAVRLRSGGERLQPDPRRPRRTLKNLFQEAGVPPWQRDRLPLLFCGDDLVWAPGLGVDAQYQATADAMGVVPEWR